MAWSGFCACDACEELVDLSIPTAERGVVALGWESDSSGLRRGWHKAGDIAGYSSWRRGALETGRKHPKSLKDMEKVMKIKENPHKIHMNSI